jgi:LuxR family transcriptional regulator, activator of tox operons
MLSVQRLEGRNHIVPPLGDVAKIIAAIGRDEFARVALDALDDAIGIDHLSVFRIGTNGLIDYHEATSVGGAHISENAARQYFHRFNRLDPVRSVSGIGLARGTGLLVQNRAEDISDPLYRRECYGVPEIGERLALYASVDRRIFQINVYRRTTRTGFDEAAVDTLAKMATVLLPSAARHAEFVTGRDDQDGLRLSLVALKHRVEMLGCGLSDRELEVCARALYGQSIEGTSLELQIGRTSVATYRRRAFAKLHISCCNELFALAFRSE